MAGYRSEEVRECGVMTTATWVLLAGAVVALLGLYALRGD